MKPCSARGAVFERVPSGGQVLQVRGEYVQVIDVAQRFGMHSTQGARRIGSSFCARAKAEPKVALVVDDIIGQQQVVIKSLEENFE